MRCPPEWYQLHAALLTHLPELRPAQRQGLAWWVYGTILAQSACQSAVVTALLHLGRWHTWRQYLREWRADGCDKAAPCQTQLEVSACFAPLLRWVCRWWQDRQLALAVDATYQGERWVVLVVSVLYQGSAIPVAWHVLPARQAGAWGPHLVGLLRSLAAAVPPSWTVLVLTDRGLWSPTLWQHIRALGWHPLMRVRPETTFAPAGQTRRPARHLVPGPGHAWVGRGVAFKHQAVRRAGTLVVVWATGQAEPWLLLTDLAPERIGVVWYGLRVWTELGFRALKRLGWQWQKTRRTDPARVARHWLVLAVATLWVLAYGTRVAEAQAVGRAPAGLRVAPQRVPPQPRRVSLFRRGLTWLQRHLLQGRLWRQLWLRPAPWPTPAAELQISYHADPCCPFTTSP